MRNFDPAIKDGVAYVLFAYDVGLGIGLDAAEKSVKAMTERAPIRHQRRAPKHFEFEPTPLRVTQVSTVHLIAGFATLPAVETVLYDFGAVCVTYQIPLTGPFSGLLALSEALYDNETLLADSRRLVEELLAGIMTSVKRPHIAHFYEDYVIFQLREFEGMSYEDIAQIMNCPIGTVRSRIFRAREAIAEQLKPLLDTGDDRRW